VNTACLWLVGSLLGLAPAIAGLEPDGLVRVWERPDAGVNTHRAYALQWYVMGLMIAVLYFSLNLKRTDDNA